MRVCYRALFLIAIILSAPALCSAQVYVSDYYSGYIWSYADTVGTIVNPQHQYWSLNGMALNEDGNLLLANGGDVILFDVVEQFETVLEDTTWYWQASDVYPDALSEDIYVLRRYIGEREDAQARQEPELQYLPGGTGPGQTAYYFGAAEIPREVMVWPFGSSEGNILVLGFNTGSGYFLANFERTGPTTFDRLDDLFSGEESSFISFGISPDEDIVVLESSTGLHVLDDGELVPFGQLPFQEGAYEKVSVGSDGTIYVTDSYTNVTWRLDPSGNIIYPSLTDGVNFPGLVEATAFTPTHAGENVMVSPADGVEILFEIVEEGGYTTAALTPSDSHTSPNGNYLPGFASPASGREDFTYVDISTGSVYSMLIQVDVYFPGSRLFYAHGTQDTFRDRTVVGSIEDARGVISRFSEVVLAEDTRPLTTVIAYKFERLLNLLTIQPPVDNSYCPFGSILHLQQLALRAEQLYDLGEVDDALEQLARLNGLVRDQANWCIPDTTPDNVSGEILARSKTLMFSLGLVPGAASGQRDGLDEGIARLALSAKSPAVGSSTIEFSGPADAGVTARVYSVSGRLVASLYDGRLTGGVERIVWDGTDSSGRRVAAGVYFVRVESEDENVTAKVVLLR
jgi:hypothetical protein